MYQRCAGGIEKLRCAIRGYLIGRIHAVEMRHVTVHILRVVPITHPFLKLPPMPYTHRRDLFYAGFETVGKLLIGIEYRCSCDDIVPQLCDKLIIHGGTSHSSGIVPLWRIFRGVARTYHKLPALRLIHHGGIKEFTCTFHDGISLTKKFHITCVQIMLPQMTAQPCSTAHPHP